MGFFPTASIDVAVAVVVYFFFAKLLLGTTLI